MKINKMIVTLGFCVATISTNSMALGSWDTNPNNWKNSINNFDNSPNNFKNSPNNFKNSPNNYGAKNGFYDNDGKRQGYCVGSNCYKDKSGERIGYGY